MVVAVVVVVGDGLAQVGMHAQVLVIVYVEIIPFSLAGMIHVLAFASHDYPHPTKTQVTLKKVCFLTIG